MLQCVLGRRSVERMVGYIKRNEPEAPPIVDACRPPTGWPSQGDIDVQKLVVQYRPDLPHVLKGLSFHIRAKHKVVVGASLERGRPADTMLSLSPCPEKEC